MDELQIMLESVDVAEQLPVCVDPLILISQSYPQVLSKHFRDIVDILVGWHIDHMQSISLVIFCADALIKLQPHWQNDMEFSLLLLNQFLEDMEAYAEGLQKLQNASSTSHNSDSSLPKIAALMRAFSAVVRSIGCQFHVEENPLITETFVLEMLQRIIICDQLVDDMSFAVACAANECIQLLIAAVQWRSEEMLSETLLTYVVHGVERSNTEKRILLILRLVTVMVQEIGSALPTWFIVGLLGPSSRLLPLKCKRNPRVTSELLLLCQACLSVKNVSLLQTAYRNVVGELQSTLNRLLQVRCRQTPKFVILKQNPFSDAQCESMNDVKQRESHLTNTEERNMLKIAIFNLTAISEVSDAKNSIIGMYALAPSIFELLHTELSAVHDEPSNLYPQLQYTVLYVLYSHCQRHKHFVHSYLGGSAPHSSVPNAGTVATVTHGYYPQILSLISSLILRATIPTSTRTLLLHWSQEVMRTLAECKDSYVTLISETNFENLVHALSVLGTHCTGKQMLTVADCMITVFKMLDCNRISASIPVHQTRIYRSGLNFCLSLICNTDPRIHSATFDLQKVPVSQMMRFCDMTSSTLIEDRKEKSFQCIQKTSRVIKGKTEHVPYEEPNKAVDLRHMWLAKRGHMVSMQTQESRFFPHHFKKFIDRLLSGKLTSNFAPRLERMYWSCQRSLSHPNICRDSAIADNYCFIYWWALWECALLTVSNKLRTPLGRPQHTFQQIEAALREYEQQIDGTDCPNKTTKLAGSDSTNSLNDNFKQSVMQRPQLLLQFLYSLEKLMFNAYSGCISISVPNKAVRTFFSTNQYTCEQWLNRLRLASMKIALNCGLPCTALFHGQKILQDMKINRNTQGVEFEQAVLMTIESALILNCPQLIEGMYRWCREISKNESPAISSASIKQMWSWMKPAKSQANHCYDDAVKEYQSHYHTFFKKDRDGLERGNSAPQMQATQIFIMQQMSNCYIALEDWKNASKWITRCKESNSEPLDQPLPSLQYLEALSSFEDQEYESAKEKCHSVLENLLTLGYSADGQKTPGACGQRMWRWSYLETICDVQLMLTLINHDVNASRKRKMDNSQSIPEKILQLNMHYWPIYVNADFLSLFAIWNCIASGDQISLSVNVFKDSRFISAGNRLFRFLNSRQRSENSVIDEESLFSFQLSACRMHRKHRNYGKCLSIFKHLVTAPTSNDNNESGFTDMKHVMSACQNMKKTANAIKMKYLLDVQYELSKQLIVVGNVDNGLLLMADTLLSWLDGGQSSERSARALLSLAKYLQMEWKTVGIHLQGIINPNQQDPENELLSKFTKLIRHQQLQPSFKILESNRHLLLEANTEIILGTLLNAATLQSPDLAKAWFTSAGWCYKWGRKIVDSASNSGNVELTDEEKHRVREILQPYDVRTENLSTIFTILSQAHCSASTVQEDDIVTQRSQNSDTSKIILNQLLSCNNNWLQKLPESVSNSLLAIWQNVCARLFSQYHDAVQAYFKFLRLNVSNKSLISYEDSNVIATLRLLRLLAKHALELQSSLKNGLEKTPTTPWNGIIPQLFSRLNHPETYVRQSISELLCRVAKDTAFLVVYPVVVATTHADRKSRVVLRNSNLDSIEQEDNNLTGMNGTNITGDVTGMNSFNGNFDPIQIRKLPETEITSQSDSIEYGVEGAVNACYQSVLETLKEGDSDMISDAQLLVLELCRITLLWDELWLGTLNQHQQDIMRRLHQLHDEGKRINQNNSLSKEEKHTILREQQQAIMRPVVYALHRVQQITGITPETPHECWFAKNIQPLIDEAMKRLVQPSNLLHPNSCWSGFKQLHFQLNTRASKRSSQILNMGEISPKLMKLNPTSVPIPGVSLGYNGVTIQGCSSVVTILPTKTKPKKLQFVGSDNMRYTFLFKGLEDLHLDERIMQFLFITNQLLKRQHENDQYMARHYSVTPLGARSGLIQWVDGATPLFTLYKRWQQRQASQQATGPNSVSKPVMRPSEVYYSKLNPALKEAGIEVDKVSRKDWPNQVLCSVLKKLIADTPPDLLQRELWCSSTCPAKYWDIQKKYSCSTAVMSMIGYVIGLGDRHLDNVLVDLETGEVVHIDYNVCFEKGIHLRVPERVPFRLTQNIKTALGLTGVEGIFRHACEQIVSTLRKGRETLLTLLEAFVYDPLVDWTGAVEGGYAGAVYGGGKQQEDTALTTKLSKHDIEREITRSLFSSRIAEMKRGWLENRDEMMKALPEVVRLLQEYKKHFTAHVEMSSKIQNLLELKAQVKASLTDPHHPYNNLRNRWTQHNIQQSKMDAALHAIEDVMSTSERNMERFRAFLSSTQSPELAGLLASVSSPLQLGEATYESAITFLNSAGQANMVSQAQATEKELLRVSEQCRLSLHSCLDALTTYAAIAAQFPPTAVITNHQEAMWSSILSLLKNNFTKEVCDEIRRRLDVRSSEEFIATQARLAAAKDATLQQEITDLNNLLLKLLDRRDRNILGQDIGSLEKTVNITQDRILEFVQDNGYGGMHSILSVVTLALTALERRGITMETTAAKASHRLVDMTSQDGDWFLEELCSLFGNVVQLVRVGEQILSGANISSSVSVDAVRGVMNVDSCFCALLDLFNHFRNIILPEAVKLLQCEELSVVEFINAFNSILQGVRLDECVKHLMGGLRGTNIAVCDEALLTVGGVQTQYNLLLQTKQDEKRLTAGQMLLQGFDGLFHTVHSQFLELIHMQNRMLENVKNTWYICIDVLAEPEDLQKIRNITSSKEKILQAVLFVKQLQAMHDFFVFCQSNARSFVVDRQSNTGSGPHHGPNKNLYSEERLMKPVKHYIAHFVQELLVGIPSLVLGITVCSYLTLLGINIDDEISANPPPPHTTPYIVIEDLCKHVAEKKYPQTTLNKQRMLIYQFNRAWKDFDRAKRLDVNITAIRASLQRGQLQLTRFQWLHEDILLESSSPNFIPPRRSDVLSDLSKRMNNLQQLDALFQQLQETAISQNKAILQRLKWAAGANPSLQTVLQEVDKSIQQRNVKMLNELTLSTKVAELCRTAIDFEECRINVGSKCKLSKSTNAFLQIIENCEQICRGIASAPVKILPQEMELVNIALKSNDASAMMDDWLLQVGDCLKSCLMQLRQARQQEESRMQTVKNKLVSAANEIKHLQTINGKLLSDVKSQLKVLAKGNSEDGGKLSTETSTAGHENDSENVGNVRQFLEGYKDFCAKLNELLRDVSQGCECSTMSDPDPLIQRLSGMTRSVSRIYDGLINLANPSFSGEKSQAQPSFATALRDGMKISDQFGLSEKNTLSGTHKSSVEMCMHVDGESVEIQDPTTVSDGNKQRSKGRFSPVIEIASDTKLKGIEMKKKTQDPRTGKAVQERNCFAVSVWRRVKAKLDGRDVDSSRRMQVTEQVEYVINEATSHENLGLLYEGWTAWV